MLDDAEKQKLKYSVASISARMSHIAAMKRSFAEFLQGKPRNISEFSPLDQMLAEKELKRIDREIAGFEEDLKQIDPQWAAQYSTLYEHLYVIGHGKGLWFDATLARNGAGEDMEEMRNWMLAEAKKLDAAAAEITSKLPT